MKGKNMADHCVRRDIEIQGPDGSSYTVTYDESPRISPVWFLLRARGFDVRLGIMNPQPNKIDSGIFLATPAGVALIAPPDLMILPFGEDESEDHEILGLAIESINFAGLRVEEISIEDNPQMLSGHYIVQGNPQCPA